MFAELPLCCGAALLFFGVLSLVLRAPTSPGSTTASTFARNLARPSASTSAIVEGRRRL